MGEKKKNPSREDFSGHAHARYHRTRLDFWKVRQHSVGTHVYWGNLPSPPFGWVSHSFLGNIGKLGALRPAGCGPALGAATRINKGTEARRQGEGSYSHSGRGQQVRPRMVTVALVPFGRLRKLQPFTV